MMNYIFIILKGSFQKEICKKSNSEEHIKLFFMLLNYMTLKACKLFSDIFKKQWSP